MTETGKKSRKDLAEYRKANGLCTQCGQLRPRFKLVTQPPINGSTKAWKQNQAKLKREIAALHPDLNAGCSPDESRLRMAIVQLRKKRARTWLRVAPGFRVFARKAWWTVKKHSVRDLYTCHRFIAAPGSSVVPKEAVAIIALSEMTDSRTGPDFRYRMVSATAGGGKFAHGIPWNK